MKRFTDLAALILGWTFVVAALFLLLRPEGLLRSEIESVLADRRQARIVAESWPQLAGDAPVVGSGSASPFAIEFIDYQCSYCRHFHRTLDSLVSASALDVRLAIRHNPIRATQLPGRLLSLRFAPTYKVSLSRSTTT